MKLNPNQMEVHYVKRWRDYDGNYDEMNGLYSDFDEADHSEEIVGTHLSSYSTHSIEVNTAGVYEVMWSASGYKSGDASTNCSIKIYDHAASADHSGGGDMRFWHDGTGNNNSAWGGQTILQLSAGDRVGLYSSHLFRLYTVTLSVRYLGPAA